MAASGFVLILTMLAVGTLTVRWLIALALHMRTALMAAMTRWRDLHQECKPCHVDEEVGTWNTRRNGVFEMPAPCCAACSVGTGARFCETHGEAAAPDRLGSSRHAT